MTCKNLNFQLELMQHDHVMRESFQKIQDWVLRDLCPELETLDANVGVAGTTPAASIITDCPCDASVYVGAAVKHASGLCQNAQADTVANSRVIGFAVSKTTATLCNVVVAGPTGDIFSGLDISRDYFLSPTIPGAVQTTPPTASGQIVAFLGRSISAKNLIVNVSLRMQRAL